MKKNITLLMVLGSLLAFTSCGGKAHEHEPSSSWSKDGSYHWHTCSGCEDLLDKSSHQWDEGVETTIASDSNGKITYTCTVCEATKEESVSAFAKVGYLEDKTWSKYENFALYAKRDAYNVKIRLLSDNTVFTSEDRDSKIEVYFSTGNNVSYRDGNDGITRLTISSDLTYNVFNYGGKEVSINNLFVKNNIDQKTVIDISFNYSFLGMQSDEVLGLSFGLWSENDNDWASMYKLNTNEISSVEDPTQYVRIDKYGNCFESSINDYPENVPTYDKDALTHNYTYNVANPISVKEANADDIYLNVSSTDSGFVFDMLGFGEFTSSEYLKLVLHTSEDDGFAWGMQESDVSFLISSEKAIRKTGETYFWDFTNFEGEGDALSNNQPTYTLNEEGYFYLSFEVDYSEIPNYEANGEVSFFMFEFNDGYIYNADPMCAITKDGIGLGDGALQVSYIVIQEKELSVDKNAILADYRYRFSGNYYADFERNENSLTLNVVSFNKFNDDDFIRFVIDVDSTPTYSLWELNSNDVSFTIYKDVAYSSTNNTSFWDKEDNNFHEGFETLNVPVYTEYADYWTLSLTIDYSEIGISVEKNTALSGLLVYFNPIIQNYGFNFDGFIPADIGMQGDYFKINTYDELEVIKNFKGFNYKFSNNYHAKIERNANALKLTIRSFVEFSSDNFIRFIIDVDGKPTNSIWSLDSNDVGVVIYSNEAYISKGYDYFWADEDNDFHNDNSLKRDVTYEASENYWTLTMEIAYSDLGENINSTSDMNGLLVAYEYEIVNAGFNFNGYVPQDIAYQNNYFNF